MFLYNIIIIYIYIIIIIYIIDYFLKNIYINFYCNIYYIHNIFPQIAGNYRGSIFSKGDIVLANWPTSGCC